MKQLQIREAALALKMFMDSPYETRLALGQWRGDKDINVGNSALQKDKKDTLPMKRFKPCYYSPIQCLIKRR
ncbi:hypothetical protein ANCCEY_11956 [Ancylostoma ceylanicum]|uniref:Uncharacterized protein n=1 Tax=Ancylostoma ceylanicum TaxID=53326 RepID=A0A0D6LAR9_9BILA|nr:hypothetical protein ANCCEY_11956 [Ancylostoma ceylanicum]